MNLTTTHLLTAVALLQCATAVVARPPEAAPRRQFVLGMPGRLAAEGDQRRARMHRGDSYVRAYADVEQVEDGTWLRHEAEGYARAQCAAAGGRACRPVVREVAGATLLSVVRGPHAEVVWVSGGDTAVRVGWQRVVHHRDGTMTVDTPPLDFVASLLADLPSDLALPADGDAPDGAWTRAEVDRLLYYAARAKERLPVVPGDAERRRLLALVAGNLAMIGELCAAHFGGPSSGELTVLRGAEALATASTLETVPLEWEERIEAVRAWWTGSGPQTAGESDEPLCQGP